MWGPRSSRTAVILTAAAVFIVACVLPPVYMLWAIGSAHDPLSAVGTALLDNRQRGLLSTTILLGSGTAALATVAGAAFGVVLARIAVPFKSALRLALVAPAVLPPYVIALAWTLIAGRRAFGVTGAITALAVAFYPIAMLATEVGLRRIDPRLEEAGLLVTTPSRVLRRISWPLALPSVISAALVIFVLAISDFSVPGLLRVRVFTTEVFAAFAALYDFGRATILSLPLLVVSFVVAGWSAFGLGDRLVTTRRPVLGSVSQPFDGWRRPALTAVGVGLVLVLVAPLVALAREALRSTSISQTISSSREAATTSLLLALVGATAVTLVALVLGYARARAPRKIGTFLDSLWVILFTVPSTVVGMALIGIWNRQAFGGVYGTPAMLVLAYLARFVPIGALAIAAAVRSVPRSHEEAAAIAGAGWWRTMTRIVLPQIRLGLLAVWVVVFILAFGEVGASILVAPPGETTLPIRVYTLTANAPPGHVAALALLQSAVVLCPLILLGTVLARREPR